MILLVYFHLSLFKSQMEIPTRTCLFLHKGGGPHVITHLSPLCPDTAPRESYKFKHVKTDLEYHRSHPRKYHLFAPCRVIKCNFKSISCLTMDCFIHLVFFVFFFCLITYLLHLLILVAPDTNEIFLAV